MPMTSYRPTDGAPALQRVRRWPIVFALGVSIAVTVWLVRDSERAVAENAAVASARGADTTTLTAGGRPAPAIVLASGGFSRRAGATETGYARVPDAVRLALSDADPAVRLDAIGELEDRADTESGEILALALSDPDVRVRRIAVEGLASMPAAAATGPLQRALHDEDRIVRMAAVDALADIGGVEVIDVMLIALHDRQPDVRMAVVDNLSDMDDPRARNLLQLALGDNDPAVRAAAADYLRQ